MDAIEVMLKEYESLRQECLSSIDHRNTILSFGLAAIGAIFAGSIVVYSTITYSFISSLALMIVIPFIGSLTVLMWLGEYERMQRAGKFLVEIERKINKEISRELLTWETRLREQRAHMKYPYHASVTLLIAISMVLFGIGLITAKFPAALTYLIAIVGTLFHFGLYIFVILRIAKLRL